MPGDTRAVEDREFTATYFALRIGLVAATVLVLLAPVAALIADGALPPSISDAFYTPARGVFVLGLAAGAALLVVIRGDTLTEQTLLNVAGVLGLVVAGVATVPKDRRGEPLPYDPEVAAQGVTVLGALLLIAGGVWAAGHLLPQELRGEWRVRGIYRLLLRALYPSLVVVALVGLLVARETLAERAHGPAAVLMFVLLGLVALLRTERGTALLERCGDDPVDASLTCRRRRRAPGRRQAGYDRAYAVIGTGLVIVVILAGVLIASGSGPGTVLVVEVLLLALFMAFWIVQTREAWTDLHTDPSGQR